MHRRLLVLTSLSLATLTLGSAANLAIADEPDPSVQFLIKVQYVAIKEPVGKKSGFAEADEVRRAGMVVGDPASRLRTATTAQIAAGAASVEGQMTIAVLNGVGAELRHAEKAGVPGWSGAFVPRLTEGKVNLDLKLRYGSVQGKVFSGQSFEEKLELPENGRLALRFAPSKESPRERIVHVEVVRAAP